MKDIIESISSDSCKVEGFDEEVVEVPLDSLAMYGISEIRDEDLEKKKVKIPTSERSHFNKIKESEYLKLTMPWYKRIWYKLFFNKSKVYEQTADTIRRRSFN